MSLPHGAVGWSVIVAFSVHTHLLFFRFSATIISIGMKSFGKLEYIYARLRSRLSPFCTICQHIKTNTWHSEEETSYPKQTKAHTLMQ